MSITFDNIHFPLRNILSNKKDWFLLFLFGIPSALLYSTWLYLLNFNPFFDWMLYSIASLSLDITWGLVWGFIGGITAWKADFMEQLVMTFLGGYLLIFIGWVVSLYLGISLGFGVVFLIMNLFFGFPIVISLGLIPGFLISSWFQKNISKSNQKEVEDRSYVNYANLDHGKRM